jgi:hypothetical protein
MGFAEIAHLLVFATFLLPTPWKKKFGICCAAVLPSSSFSEQHVHKHVVDMQQQ